MERKTLLMATLRNLETALVQTKAKQSFTTPLKLSEMHTWVDYAQQRGLRNWLYNKDSCPVPLKLQVLSKVLTFPVTLAVAGAAVTATTPPSHKTVHIVGAHAEATLPLPFWSELLHLCLPTETFDITFWGPNVPTGRKSIVVDKDRLTFHYRSTLYPLQDIPSPSFYVFFHPGFAITPTSWLPVLEHVMKSGAPMVVTGYNETDYARDLSMVEQLIQDKYEVFIKKPRNKFKCLVADEIPPSAKIGLELAENKLVERNACYFCVRPKQQQNK